MAKKNGNGRIVYLRDNVERTLKVDLAPDDFKAHAQRLAELEAEIASKTESRKVVAAEAKTVIDNLGAERKKLAEEYRQGWGWREVRCRTQKDLDAREHQVVREDLDEIVERRPLRDEELQATIGEHGA